MMNRFRQLSIVAALTAIAIAILTFGVQVQADPCEVDGPCVRDCQEAFESCRDGCKLPDGTYDLPCVSNCAATLTACASGCTTCE